MATRFQLKRSSVGGVIPTTGDIATAELAVNLVDQKLYTSNGSLVFELGANVVNLSVTGNATIKAISANGSLGTSGQVLTSNGSAIYWSTTGGSGTVTSVATGDGLSGGPITTSGTVSVLANTGIVANSTGLFVNAAYINTISSNSATYANSSVTNTFTVGTSGYFVSNGNLGLGNTEPVTKLQVAGNYSVLEVVIASTNAININCASGNFFFATANGSATTITFSSVPANTGYGFVLVLANGGSNTVTWSSSPKWPSATAPTVSSNTDVFTFITDDGGTTWRGVQSMKDVR